MKEFDPQLCDVRYTDINRRVSNLETSLSSNFQRVYDKIEQQTLVWAEKAAEASRRPGWATLTIIALMSSVIVGMVTFVLTHN